MKLCILCNREFSPRSEIIVDQKFGKERTEKELWTTICDNCKKDGGESEEIMGEEIT